MESALACKDERRPGVAPESAPAERAGALHPLLDLQSAIGNRAVGSLLGGGAADSPTVAIQRKCAACAAGATPCTSCSPAGAGEDDDERLAGMVQPKLLVSRPGDPEEQEADRMAEAAARPAGASSGAAREPAGVEIGDLPAPLRALRGAGSPLPASLRADLDARFDADFSAVRVHTGGQAAALADRFGAGAFTVGRDVVFGDGRYAPGTPSGMALLSHELAHVVQQRGTVGATRLQRRVVDDDEHLPCRAIAGRTAADVTALENEAADKAEAAATALGVRPIADTTRGVLWRRFRLDYNQWRVRCRIVPELAARFAQIARAIRNTDATYRCTATEEPEGLCETTSFGAVTYDNLLSRRIDLCSRFWLASAPSQARLILHEWAHYEFMLWSGLHDDLGVPFDNAECYAAFAFELAGLPHAIVEADCPSHTAALPALDAVRVGAECPPNLFAAWPITGGYLYGLPGARHYGTVSTGWDLLFPLTRMHEWELSLGPRITAAIPSEGGARPPMAYFVGVRTALQFRYRPWRFGVQVGGYAELGAALMPDETGIPDRLGEYRLHPYASGGLTGGLNIPIGAQEAFQLFVDVGGGAGLNTSDRSAFGWFQAGLGAAFQFQ